MKNEERGKERKLDGVIKEGEKLLKIFFSIFIPLSGKISCINKMKNKQKSIDNGCVEVLFQN